MESPDFTLQSWIALGVLALVPFVFYFLEGLGAILKKLTALIRMVAQLALMGFYLGFLFEWNTPWINISWFFVMVLVAGWTNFSHLGKLPWTVLGFQFIALGLSGALILAFFNFFVVGAQEAMDAWILVPIGGMLLGNSIRGNLLAQRHFLGSIRRRKKEWEYWLVMGASTPGLRKKFRSESLAESIAPMMVAMANTGLVSIPGMMTGQLLGGSLPVKAVSYQIGIMLAIVACLVISSYLILMLLSHWLIDSSGRIRTARLGTGE